MATMVDPAAITVPSDAGYAELRRALDDVQEHLPPGFKAEIIGGRIVMSPWSKGRYRPIMRSFVRQVEPFAPEGHVTDTSPFLFSFPGLSRDYGPDIHVSDLSLTDVDSIHLPGEALSLVGEVTSVSTADADRSDKVAVYGRAGVPVYVLIDALEGAVTVFWSPSEHGYRSHARIDFGDTIRIPAPFDCPLDTSDWKR